jgi:hypothetical protein
MRFDLTTHSSNSLVAGRDDTIRPRLQGKGRSLYLFALAGFDLITQYLHA